MKYLAKLREFRQGMDVEKYLQTEFRQNLQAIGSFMGDNSELFYDPVHIYASPEKIIENTSEYFDITGGIVRAGTVTNSFYYPNTAGRYFIEYSAKFDGNTANGQAYIDALSSETTTNFTIDSTTGIIISAGITTARPHHVGFFADLTPKIGVGFRGVSSVIGLTISNFNLKITKVG